MLVGERIAACVLAESRAGAIQRDAVDPALGLVQRRVDARHLLVEQRIG